MPRFTGPADPERYCSRIRVEIVAGGEEGAMDVLVFPAGHGSPWLAEPVPRERLIEILEAALAIARGMPGVASAGP